MHLTSRWTWQAAPVCYSRGSIQLSNVWRKRDMPVISTVFILIFSSGLIAKETNQKNASDKGGQPPDASIFSTFSCSYFAKVNTGVDAA
jgi:hypothetical protein